MTREQLVPDLVAQLVVDRLEAVDVAEEHSDMTSGALGLQQGVLEVVEQEPPVGQAREGILEGMPCQLFLEGLALRDVTEHDHCARW